MATKKRSIPLADSGIDWTQPAGAFTPSTKAEEQAAEEAPKDGMMRRYVGDTAASLGRGAVQGVRMLTDTAGADNAVSTGLRSVEDFIGSLQSASAKADQQEMARILKEAEGKGVLDQVVAGFKAFGVAPLQTMAQAAGTSLPTIGAALIPGVGPAAVATRFAAPLALGAAQGAGAVKSTIYDEVKQRALQEGRTPAEAEQLASQAQEYSSANGGQIALGAGLGAWAGKSGLEGAAQRLVYGTGGKAAGGMAARVATGAVAEGIPEALQGGQEKYAGNVAQTGAGFPTDAMGGVVANATMEGLAGHVMGGVMGIPNPNAPAKVVDPAAAIRATKQPEGGPMTRAANAAIEAQAQAADAGMPSLPTMTAEQEQAALAAIEAQGGKDAKGLRQFAATAGRATGARPAAGAPAGQSDPGQDPAEPSATVSDMPFGDRVLTLREQLGDQATRQALRDQFGDEALSQATYYASIADRPDVQLPNRTRDNMLALAERMVSMALLKPINRPGLDGAGPAPDQLAGPSGEAPLQIELDTTPTGTIRVDGEGNAAPETRADAIDTKQATGESLMGDERQARKASAVNADPAPAAEPGTPALGYDTKPTGTMRAGRNGVATPETGADRANTRQAKAAIDAEAQRRADLGLTPDVQAVQDRNALPKPLDSDIKNPKGQPFTHKRAAETAQKKAKGGTVLQVAGGWVVRPAATDSATVALSPTQEPSNVQAASVPPAAAPTAQQEGADSAGAGAAEAAAPGAAGPTGAAPAPVEADGVAPAKPVMLGKLPDKSGYGASIGGLSTGDRRQLMVDPAGGYFWGEWGEASARDGSNPVVGKHASFTPAKFDGGKEGREAAAATPQSKTEPSGGNAPAAATPAKGDQTPADPPLNPGESPNAGVQAPANVPESAIDRRNRLKAERTEPAERDWTAATPAEVETELNRLDADHRKLNAKQLKVPGIDSPERMALLRQMDDIDAQRAKLVKLLPDEDAAAEQDPDAEPKFGEPGYVPPENWKTSRYQARQYLKDMGVSFNDMPGELADVLKLIDAKLGNKPAAKKARAPKAAPTKRVTNPDGSYYNAPVDQAPAPAPAASANTIFTEEAAAAARARLKAKLGRLNSGLDPETMMDGITLAGYHIEKGARRFAAFARAMVDDLGDGVKPYLQSWYMAVRGDPRAADMRADMDKASAVEDLDVDEVLAAAAEPAEPTGETMSAEQAEAEIQRLLLDDDKLRPFLTNASNELHAVSLTARPYMEQALVGLFKDGKVTGAAYDAVAGRIKDAGKRDTWTATLRALASLKAPTSEVIEQPQSDEDVTLGGMGATTSPNAPTTGAKPDTAPQEATNDPTPTGDAPALDQPLVAGPGPEAPTASRGTRQPRRKPGRTDDRSVRGQGGLFEGDDDASGDVGDGQGAAGVPDGPADAVAGGGGRVSAPDFRPAVGGLKREGSWFKTAERNLDLIELARKIEDEKRDATPDEQALLAKYVGFGASEIRNNLFPVPQPYHRAQAAPGSLIFPAAVYDARWKALAERAAALPIDWQRTILQSTQYAHYTSEGIIRSVWSAVQRLGFTGGRVFEPGGGIGSFAMLMPDAVYKTSKFTGIEFDGPTALIARLLSPGQNMLHDDFIRRRLPDNFFDVSVGNPPFSQTKITADPRYQKHGFMLHDYFFAKAIDKVRPGGLLAFVTSKGTMDKKTDKARRYLMERADLVGAIRLPSTAFEENAGTSVVTDVIFLRKRMPGEAPGGQPWGDVATVETKDGPVVVNQYFAANPEMVLGQQRISGNTDDMGRRINSNGMGGEKYTVVSYDTTTEELDAKFAAAVERLPQNVYSALAQEPGALKAEVAKMDFDPKVKREGVVYVGKGGALLRVEDGIGKPLADAVKLSAKDAAWLTDYVGVRDLVKEAQLAQVTDGAWEAALKKLNKAYDAFVKKNGPINAFRVQVRKTTDEEGNEVEAPTRIFTNRRLFREDYDSALMTQLEVIDEDGNVKKAAFLSGRTIGKPVTREVKSIGDALAVSLDAVGRLDLADVAARLRITRDEAIEALGSQIYKEPGGDWLLADEYLSGNVVDKLAEAMEAARLDRSLERNVAALKEVQPEKLGPSQISVMLGAPWVDARHVNDFAATIEAGRVSFDPKTETWQVDGGNLRSERRAGAEYGTAARSPSELLEAILNSRSIKVMQTVDKKQVPDLPGTTAANEMAKKIKDKFKTWVWTDSERAADLVESYNDRYNNLAPRAFDGSHLTLPGVSLRYKLHPHQLRAIWRQIQTGSTYLAHAVGAGKTIEMIAGGMEQKRLGLIRKPIYVVPNHMLEQFSNEFMELYPLANIMVADDQNFSKERRKAFVAAATLNNPDAIVITHDAFQRIGVKPETINPIRDEILADLEEELTAVAKDAGARVRRGQLEQQIEAVNQRFDSILAAGKKDGIVDFEDMGVDMIFADEAHVYRKLDFHTAQSIKGIDPNGSRRALDMYVKARHLDRLKPGRAMVFASGTAVTNTMGELFTIMRFFDPKMLDEGGISTFDSWARMFGEVASALEPNAAGKYEVVERFAKFNNVPELMARVRKFMDVLQSDQLGAIVKRPDTRGGKPDLILVQPTKAMKEYQETVLQPRLEISRAWKPSKDEPNNPDPVIAIISDGRLAASDPRFIPGGRVLPGETTKIDEAAKRIAAEYLATADNEYVERDGKTPMKAKGGTQIVFYNVGFGAASSARRGFDSRGTFTKAIVAGGVKREHIVWFDDADTDAKKEAIFKGMRNGTYRVLIGSAKKMGTGVNVQNRLTTLHYMDPPWFPADVEQPRGRIVRQGNQNPIVDEKWYATKGGYDSTMWQMVGRKQRFIDQAFRGDKNLRSMEDLGEASMYEQAAALASGDPRALLLAGLRQDTERLERQQAAHSSEQLNARQSLRSAEWTIEAATNREATYAAAYKAIGGAYFQFSAGIVRGTTYTKQTEFGQALKDEFNKGAAAAVLEPGRTKHSLGTIGDGMALTMHAGFHYVKEGKGDDAVMVKVPSGRHQLTVTAGGLEIDVGDEVAAMGSDVDALGLARKVVNALNGIESDLRRARATIADENINVTRLKKKIGAPFEHQQEMLEKWAALKELEEELRLEGLAKPPGADADDGPADTSTNRAQTGDAAANETDVVFSRGEAQQQPASTRRKAVEALVQQIAARWANAPEVVVIESMSDPRVPEAVRKEDNRQQSQGAAGEPEGFFYGGKVYLIAPQLGGDADVVRVLFHETLGHFGLRGTFGTSLGGILDRVAILQAAKVRAKAKQYGLDFDKPSDRRAAAEEVLADMAQATPDLGWGRKAIAAVRTWLRTHVQGFRQMALSDDEVVRSFILPARAFVQRGGPAGGPAGGKPVAYSRTVAAAVRDFSQAGARNAFLDAVTTHGGTNLWSRTVGTQYHKAKTNPTTFGRVFDAVQEYIKDTSVFANRAADNAPSLLPKLDSWLDLKKGGWRHHGAKPADTAKAGEAIFRGTLDKVLYDDETLASRFGLNELQRGLYREFRLAVNESLDGMTKSEMLRLAGDDGRAVRAEVLEAPDAEAAAEVLTAHLTELAELTANDDLLGTVARIGQKVKRMQQLQDEGYAPLMRFGKHTLHVQRPDGSTEFFGMYESVREANMAARAMRGDEAMAGMTFTQGVMSEQGHKLFNGMSLDALELFADATDNAQNPVYQEYLKLALSNRSAMKRMIERKAIKGYSDDVARVLASFVTSNARMSAGNLHLTDAKKMAEAIPKEVGDLRDDAINLVEYVTNPTEEAAAMRALLFTSFIGGSVASALVNMTQPFTMTLPYLTQWGGVAKAGKRLVAAMAMVASGKGMDADLADALARAEQDGIVSPQEIHHLQAEAMNTLGKHPFLKKAAFVWGAMFSLAEQFNRRVSFVAAYQTAQAEGIANPFEFAELAVVETQGLYNKGNKANWARGAIGAAAMTFKQFSTHYLEWLVRMAKSGPDGRKAVAVALALLLLTAGAGGLPFADDLDDLIDTLGQAMGHDTNSKRWKRQFVSQTLGLGDDAAEVATRGLSAPPGMPIDLSLRMGLGNLLPATGLFLRSSTDTGRQLLEIAGAAGGLAANVMDGVKKAAGGDVVGGVMNAMPVAVQNMAKAAQMWDTGEYRNKKGDKVMGVDAVDGAMKFIGFQPAAIARESGRISENLRTVQLAKNVETEIVGRWARGMADNDQEAVKSARQELADWNKANPQAPIRITMPQVIQRLKAMRASRAERTLKQTPKELRPLVSETLK